MSTMVIPHAGRRQQIGTITLFPGFHKAVYSAMLVGVWIVVFILVVLFATLVQR